MEKMEPSYTAAGRKVNCTVAVEKSLVVLRIENIELPYDPETPFVILKRI